MTPSIPEITLFELLLALSFVLAAQAGSILYGLGLTRDLTVGTLRTFGQLFLMGYVLTYIFKLESSLVVGVVFVVMVAAASRIIRSRVTEKRVSFFWTMLPTMLLSYFVVSYLVVGVVIGVDPWWEPRYFIPLSGMVIGNSMTAAALSLDRLFSDFRAKRETIEMFCALGADEKEAGAGVVRDALRAGMIPSINSMMAVGLVFIPGMMSGQILAGADPLIAIRYQIVVMLMLVGATAICSILLILLVRRKCFGPAGQPIL